MRPGRTARRLRDLYVLGTLLLTLASGLALGAPHGPAGKTLYVGSGEVDTAIFESDAPVRSDEQSKPAVLFDPSVLPSDYPTFYVES